MWDELRGTAVAVFPERLTKVTALFSGLQIDVVDTFGVRFSFDFVTNDDRCATFDIRVLLIPDEHIPLENFRSIILNFVLRLGKEAVAPDAICLGTDRWQPADFTCPGLLPDGFVVRITWRRATLQPVTDASDVPQPLADLAPALGEEVEPFEPQLLDGNDFDNIPIYWPVAREQGIADDADEPPPARRAPARSLAPPVPPPQQPVGLRRRRDIARLQRVMTLKDRERRVTMGKLIEFFIQHKHNSGESCPVCEADVGAGYDPRDYFVCKHLHFLCPPCHARWTAARRGQPYICTMCREETAYLTVLTPINTPTSSQQLP